MASKHLKALREHRYCQCCGGSRIHSLWLKRKETKEGKRVPRQLEAERQGKGEQK